jgi:hypothetical protein
VDQLTRPRRKARVPAVPAWDTVKVLLEQCGAHFGHRDYADRFMVNAQIGAS